MIDEFVNKAFSEKKAAKNKDLVQAFRYAVMLLFSERSIKTIYSLYIDTNTDLMDLDDVNADLMFEAYNFLVEKLGSLKKKTILDYMNSECLYILDEADW